MIKGTEILAEIKGMLSRDKDQAWKTDTQTHNKEHKITKYTYKVRNKSK